jgi:two-component system, cell cycle response regulator
MSVAIIIELLKELQSTAFAIIDDEGKLLQASAGFLKLLPENEQGWISKNIGRFFIQPQFSQLKKQSQIPHKGLFTLGTFSQKSQSLSGLFSRLDDRWVFLAEQLQDCHDSEYSKLIFSLSETERQLVKSNSLLKKLEETAIEHSMTDPLTQLGNRRRFDDRMEVEIARAERHNSSLHLVMCDLDDFKHVNDTYGHDVGDIVLKGFSEVIQSQIRSIDFAARVGGEEFIILIPQTNKKGARLIAERIRNQLESKVFMPHEIKITASFGVASFSAGQSAASLYKSADEALYRAKNTGKNRVV